MILTAEAIDGLIKRGKVVAGSRVDLARSGIGIAVRKGANKPDIRTPDALKRPCSPPGRWRIPRPA